MLNRYYVAHEHLDLASAFALPVDDYVLGRTLREMDELRREIAVSHSRIAELEALVDQRIANAAAVM